MSFPSDTPQEVHPALSPSVTRVPVTPAINYRGHPSLTQSPEQVNSGPSQPQWNANSYFSPHDVADTSSSPSRAVSGAKSSKDLLRRLSLIDNDRPATPEIDPRVAYPGLNLSGGIISAAFCLPHALGFESGQNWVRDTEEVDTCTF